MLGGMVLRDAVASPAISSELIAQLNMDKVDFLYARDDEDDRIDLVSVSDTTDTSCNGGPDVVAAELEGYALVDLDGDGVKNSRDQAPNNPNRR